MAGNNESSEYESFSEEALQPIVFLCAHCKAVVGDSISWASADSELRTVTLSRISQNIRIGKKLETSVEGKDMGSTFVTLNCGACHNGIGRVYKTTSRSLDSVRDLFTFDVEKIESYQLGSSDQQIADCADVDKLLMVPQAQFLSSQLRKVQAMLVSLNARMMSVEEALQVRTRQEAEETSGMKSMLKDSTKKQSPAKRESALVLDRDPHKKRKRLM